MPTRGQDSLPVLSRKGMLQGARQAEARECGTAHIWRHSMDLPHTSWWELLCNQCLLDQASMPMGVSHYGIWKTQGITPQSMSHTTPGALATCWKGSLACLMSTAMAAAARRLLRLFCSHKPHKPSLT
jgi:hypothetical protein